MKKMVLLSLVMATIAVTAGCANGLPKDCFLRRWFCGKECMEANTVCYPPIDCPTCPPACSTCPSCDSCNTPAYLEAPIVSNSGCSSCSTAPALPSDSVIIPSPQPQNYK